MKMKNETKLMVKPNRKPVGMITQPLQQINDPVPDYS